MHPPLANGFFLFAFSQTMQNIFPFPHHSVTTEILSSILGEIFVLALFLVALCLLTTLFSDFLARGPGMYTLLGGIHEVTVVVR